MVAIKPRLFGALSLAASLLASGCALPAPPRPPRDACQALPKPPDTLLKLVQCCAARLDSNPSCRLYDPTDGYVILKDNARDKPQGYLILPTIKVGGIEDPLASKRPVADLWQHGWARAATYPGRPPADTALAINSMQGRSQNQLHIHISCVRNDVKAILLGSAVPSYPRPPVTLLLPPQQNAYRVVKVGALAGPLSPFLLARNGAAAATPSGDQSIAVVGSSRPGEHFLLSTSYGGGNRGSAEELLDQSCGEGPDAAAGPSNRGPGKRIADK